VADNDNNLVTKTLPVTVTAPGLIKNTGFETGSTPWVMSSRALLNNDAKEPSHAGQWDAWLGGQGSAHIDSVAQTVHITGGKSSATLNFWLHVDSSEVSTIRKFDKFFVNVYGTGGTLLGTVASFSNLDKAAGYALHSADMSAWIGQTVVIKFIGTEDGSLQTSFVLDDVTLTTK
jgi:hypothetical protein